jgi:hypothetical protein
MAVSAKVLPVASVRRVVVVIAVFMMDGQEVAVRGIKLSATTAADQTVQGQ